MFTEAGRTAAVNVSRADREEAGHTEEGGTERDRDEDSA